MSQIAIGLFVFVAGCGQQGNPESMDAPSRESVRATTQFPQVVRLAGPRLCTGTLVTSRTVLTASHCLKEDQPRAFVNGRQVKGHHFKVLGPGERNDPNDVGALTFDFDVAAAMNVAPLPIADSIRQNDVITMIGYGCSQRAMGTNRVFRIRDFIEVLWSRSAKADLPPMGSDLELRRKISGPENRAETCAGDSGGPALVFQDNEWRVAGVLHGMRTEVNLNSLSVYVDVTRGQPRDFARGALNDH
jgi:hypothetical protein